jgi:hypothetical protein
MQTVKIESEQNYAPSEVAAILNVSYDAASRLMLKMRGVVDLGTQTRRYKRGKKKRESAARICWRTSEARRKTRVWFLAVRPAAA